MLAVAKVRLTSWDETIDGGGAVTRAVVGKHYSGGIEAEGTLLMFYRDDAAANFMGLERIVGRIGNKSGEFFIHHEGSFRDGVFSNVQVVTGSGSGDLSGLRGHGSMVWNGANRESLLVSLECSFEDIRPGLRRSADNAETIDFASVFHVS